MILKNQVIVYLSLETNSSPIHTKAVCMLEDGNKIQGKHKIPWNNPQRSINLGKHITEANKKAVNYTGIFSKVSHLIPEECRLTLYNSFVFSRLTYGTEVYASTEAKFLKCIRTSQNKILKILQFRHQRSPTNDLYTNFKTLKLEEMHKMKLLSVIFKLMHTPDEFPNALTNNLQNN